MSDRGIRPPYAWVVVALSFLSVGVSTGVSQSIIILFPSILREFGWSRTILSVAPALAGATGSLGGLLVGLLSDRWDLRILMPAGAVLAALAMLLCSRVTELWQLYLFYGVTAALGTSFLGMLPNNLILARWFERGRGAAIGIVSSGYGAGIFVFMPLLQTVTRGGRWRAGYLLLAVVLLVLAPLLLMLQRSRPVKSTARGVGLTAPQAAPAGQAAPGWPAEERSAWRLAVVTRRPRFWLTYAQFILGPLSTAPLLVHQAALMRDRGLAEMETAWVVALFGLFALLGMIAAGSLSDRMGRESAYTLGTLGLIAGCVALLALRDGAGRAPAVAYAMLFGFGFGTRPSMDAATATDIFRGPGFGLVYGALSTALGLGQLGAPVLAGAIHDSTGSYNGAIVFCIVAVLVATVSIWLAAPRRGLERA